MLTEKQEQAIKNLRTDIMKRYSKHGREFTRWDVTPLVEMDEPIEHYVSFAFGNIRGVVFVDENGHMKAYPRNMSVVYGTNVYKAFRS